MKMISAGLVLGLFLNVAQAALTVEEVMQIVDSKKINTMEELLPELPRELRANFTMMRKSRSLQEATPENPRVIMFGRDARFIAAFNGDPATRGYDRFEMIQFNDREAKFEFFELSFPIARDAAGKAIRPEMNPPKCLGCHGANPHPNWTNYSTWPGAYGESDDFLEGQELASLESFVARRNATERYRHLAPMAGSMISPFSYEKRGTFQFRPNLRFGLLASRLQAKNLARSIREKGNLAKFASLIAYEVEPGTSGTPVYQSCEKLRSGKPIYGGLWGPKDAQNLQAKLEAERALIAPASHAIPEAWDLIVDLSPMFSAARPLEWAMLLEAGVADPKPADFGNGSASIRGHVTHEIADDIFAIIPELKAYAYPRSRLVEDSPMQRLVRTPFDIDFVKLLDSMNMRYAFKSDDHAHCKMLIQRIKKDWGI